MTPSRRTRTAPSYAGGDPGRDRRRGTAATGWSTTVQPTSVVGELVVPIHLTPCVGSRDVLLAGLDPPAPRTSLSGTRRTARGLARRGAFARARRRARVRRTGAAGIGRSVTRP